MTFAPVFAHPFSGRRRLGRAALALALIALPAVPARAADDLLAALVPLGEAELAAQRGGFTWQGVGISLGAEMRTYLDGVLVLQTNVAWTDAGATTSQTVAGGLTPADAAQLQAGLLTSGGITMRVGDESVYLANGGQTALIHRTDGAIQNIIANTASNVSAVQEVDAALDLQNFGAFQQDLLDLRLGADIGEAVGMASLPGLTN